MEQLPPDVLGVRRRDGLGQLLTLHPVNAHRRRCLRLTRFLLWLRAATTRSRRGRVRRSIGALPGPPPLCLSRPSRCQRLADSPGRRSPSQRGRRYYRTPVSPIPAIISMVASVGASPIPAIISMVVSDPGHHLHGRQRGRRYYRTPVSPIPAIISMVASVGASPIPAIISMVVSDPGHHLHGRQRGRRYYRTPVSPIPAIISMVASVGASPIPAIISMVASREMRAGKASPPTLRPWHRQP